MRSSRNRGLCTTPTRRPARRFPLPRRAPPAASRPCLSARRRLIGPLLTLRPCRAVSGPNAVRADLRNPAVDSPHGVPGGRRRGDVMRLTPMHRPDGRRRRVVHDNAAFDGPRIASRSRYRLQVRNGPSGPKEIQNCSIDWPRLLHGGATAGLGNARSGRPRIGVRGVRSSGYARHYFASERRRRAGQESSSVKNSGR
jgi:hypothetical protein